jgi:Fic family protein
MRHTPDSRLTNSTVHTPIEFMPGHLVPGTWQYNPTLNAPAKYRRACRYEAFVPDALSSLNLHFDARLAGLISEAESSIQQLNAYADSALAPLARLLLRTESIASSKVEGMQLGARELARAEAKAESGIRPGPTAVEVLANIDAMVLAIDEAAEVDQFSPAEIIAIHRRLFNRAPRPAMAGRIRTTQNWIGGNDYNPCGADFVPPPPGDVNRLLDDLCDAINDDTFSPLAQAALVHAQFETIHPFEDGNGRTGRALIHVVLRRRGLTPHFVPPISVLFAAVKDRYIASLTSFRADSTANWLEYFAATTDRASHLARVYISELEHLREEWRERLRATRAAPRSDAAAWVIIDALPAHPMISVPVATAVSGRSRSRVFEAMDQLAAAGVLMPVSEGKRNRWWEAAGLLDLIGQLEAGALPPPTPE